jgi:hypothetical protein
MNKHEQLEKLEKLEKELEKLKYLHKSLWESYGSELSSGDMENKEKELEYKIRKIKNEIVKDYFIERGAYPDFEITNSPMFEIKYKQKSKLLQVGTLIIPDVNYFIFNILNDLNKKIYIYNNGDIWLFEDNMISIRYATIDCDDRIIKYRKNKIYNILNNLNNE